ncbi:MAG TPA: HhH-GPD-type base excision DNA repair protein [Propionibacteriaceae bacterium]
MTTGQTAIHLTGNPSADALLSENANALLVGMVLDQQVPLEKAFSGPAVIAERMNGTFDVAAIAELSEEDFVALCAQKPAVHRFPGSMAKRVRQVCQRLVQDYDSDVERLYAQASTGAELKAALAQLPGFGEQKAAIFTALLGKQRGVTPPGWQEASSPYGDEGTHVSVADIVDHESLLKVRAAKQAAKQVAKAAAKREKSPDGAS